MSNKNSHFNQRGLHCQARGLLSRPLLDKFTKRQEISSEMGLTIILLQSFHMAGDGKLGGLVDPNDGQCHLNTSGFYDWSTVQGELQCNVCLEWSRLQGE